MSKYVKYAEEHVPKEVSKLKPTWKGWIKKYTLSFTPLIALAVYHILVMALKTFLPPSWFEGLKFIVKLLGSLFFSFLSIPYSIFQPSSEIDKMGAVFEEMSLIVSALFFLFAVFWVVRSKEAETSVGLALLFTVVGGIIIGLSSKAEGYAVLIEIAKASRNIVLPCSIIASLLTFAGTELFRRSITYTLTDVAVEFIGGIWRRQRHAISYEDIGRVIVEQSAIGKALGYGTVIPVTKSAWGEEYYTRAVGGGVVGRGIGAGVGYARTLQEISRDPMKVLYAVPKPFEIASFIEQMIHTKFRAPIDQVYELRDIKGLLKKTIEEEGERSEIRREAMQEQLEALKKQMKESKNEAFKENREEKK